MITPKIVLIGHVCIDHNRSEHAAYKGWGSSVLYMGQYLQRKHGVRPIVVSNYGPDMLEFLPAITMLPSEPSRPGTLVYENDSHTGTRIQRCHNLELADAPEVTPEIVAAVREADIVVVATLLANYPASYVRELLGHAKPTALKVLCPQGYFRHITDEGLVAPRDFIEALDIVPLFNLVMYSEEDHAAAFGLARNWKQFADTEIIVTQSALGASIIGKDAVLSVPTKPIPLDQIVDSVGCGDIFATTVAYAYWQNHDLQAAVKEAHRAATAKLLAVGGN